MSTAHDLKVVGFAYGKRKDFIYETKIRSKYAAI